MYRRHAPQGSAISGGWGLVATMQAINLGGLPEILNQTQGQIQSTLAFPFLCHFVVRWNLRVKSLVGLMATLASLRHAEIRLI